MSTIRGTDNPDSINRSIGDLPGKFLALEGIDGSGKTTQMKLLIDHLRSMGQDVLEIKFPRYGKASAYYIEHYLKGDYGAADDVPADLGVLPYALDRFAAKNEIIEHLKKPDSYVIADRYMASNLAHQGAKLDDKAERKAFYERTLKLEYDILGVPRPDLNIVLLVEYALAQKNVHGRQSLSHTVSKHDIHEADASHLKKANRNYEEICELYPNEFHSITCTENTQAMRSVNSIADDIINALSLS